MNYSELYSLAFRVRLERVIEFERAHHRSTRDVDRGDSNRIARGHYGGPIVLQDAPSKASKLIFIGAGSIPPFW